MPAGVGASIEWQDTRKIRADQFCAKKVRSGQVRPFEIQVGQIEILERFSGQIRRVIGPRCIQHCADLIGS